MGTDHLPQFVRENYEVYEWKHACAILKSDFRGEWRDLCEIFTGFQLRRSWIQAGGGNRSDISKTIDQKFYDRGWVEKKFATKMVVDEKVMETPTHKVDCFRNGVALETEWNNKDPFYDRDLNNFRLLFDLRAISVGVIVTRSDELQEIFASLGRRHSFGASTTHMSKLLPRVQGGSGGGCPLLVLGITKRLYIED